MPLIAELPAVPPVPAGAPTLAHHVRALARIIHDHVCEPTDDDQPYHCNRSRYVCDEAAAAYRDAVAALAALPVVPEGTVEIGGARYWRDPAGRLVPETLVRETDRLIDQTVRTIAAGALAVSGSLSRLKALSFSDAETLLELLAERHNVRLETNRGNYSLATYDGQYRVDVASQAKVDFGPQIEVARQLFQRWLQEAEASPEIKAIVSAAWSLDEGGRLRVREIVRLRRYEISHPTWQSAMAAVSEAMTVMGTREYLRVYERDADGSYRQITLDFSSARRAPERRPPAGQAAA